MNNKVFVRITGIVVIIAIILSINPIWGFYYYEAGKKNFNNKQYEEAVKKFEQAIGKCPDNLSYRFYYAESLAYIFKLEEAQKEFQKIIKKAPNSNAARLSSAEYQKIQDYLEQKARYQEYIVNSSRNQDNYINGITTNGKIMHWNLNKMPLKIFIDNNGGSSNHILTVKKAFDAWIGSLEGLLSYKIVSNPKEADVLVSFINSIADYKGKDGFVEISAGLTLPRIEGKILKSVTIKIATVKPDQTPVDQSELYTVALHEIGHALGIGAHSYYESDIMYPIINKRPRININLSHRDINTMRLLYKLDADISNFDPGEINNKHHDINSLILGDKDFRYDNELREAKNYVNVSPNSPYSWAKLGEAYRNLKEYQQAVNCFKKALEIDSKYIAVRERLAFVYLDMNDINSSIAEFNALIASNPASIPYSGNLALIYIKNNQYEKAQKVISALESINPKAKEDQTIKNIKQALTNKNIKIVIGQDE